MQRNNLSVLVLTALLVLFCQDTVSASRGMEPQVIQVQTHAAAAKLKRRQFVRVRMTNGREVSGFFRSFDGSRLILTDKYDWATEIIPSENIVRISGRGFLGSLRHGFSESMRILAKPVTYWIDGYKMIDALSM